MKRLQIIIIFLGIISSSLSAQHQLFYSIDGKEWQEEKDRNLYEDMLWEEFDLDANYIKKRNLPEAELMESYIPIMNLIRDFFIQCRDLNSNLKTIIEDDKGVELSKTSIIIDPIRANNNELFYFKELRTSFNLYLDHFNLISNHVRDITMYDMGQSDKIPSIDIEKFSENSTNIALAGKDFTKLANELKMTVNSYKDKTIHNSKQEERKINKVEVYYTFDGKEYKTHRGRDNYEQRLIDKYNKILVLIEDDIKDPKNIEKFKETILDNLEMLKMARSFNDELAFLENSEINKKAQKEFPTLDLTKYTARNKEVCYMKNIYDLYDPLLGVFTIQEDLMEYLEKIHKENLKAKNKKETTTISLTIDLDEYKDPYGITYKELMEKATIATNNLKMFYSKLIAFYEKEKLNMRK